MLVPLEVKARQKQLVDVKSLVQLDDPKHRNMRAVTADWFKPRALARLDERIVQLARQAVAPRVVRDHWKAEGPS